MEIKKAIKEGHLTETQLDELRKVISKPQMYQRSDCKLNKKLAETSDTMVGRILAINLKKKPCTIEYCGMQKRPRMRTYTPDKCAIIKQQIDTVMKKLKGDDAHSTMQKHYGKLPGTVLAHEKRSALLRWPDIRKPTNHQL